MTYAEMLSKLKESGLTQAQIAQKIGRSQSVVSDIQRGAAKEIRASTASAISDLYAKRFRSAPSRKRAA